MALVYPTPRCMRRKHDECDTPQWCGCDCHSTAATDVPAENTVNNLDEEIEHTARALGDDVSLLLDERGIEHEVHVEHDGDEGWYVIITAGHEVHGDVLREFTLTFATAGQRWTWQATSEDGDREGPHEETSLGGASPAEVAEHIAANVGGEQP